MRKSERNLKETALKIKDNVNICVNKYISRTKVTLKWAQQFDSVVMFFICNSYQLYPRKLWNPSKADDKSSK